MKILILSIVSIVLTLCATPAPKDPALPIFIQEIQSQADLNLAVGEEQGNLTIADVEGKSVSIDLLRPILFGDLWCNNEMVDNGKKCLIHDNKLVLTYRRHNRFESSRERIYITAQNSDFIVSKDLQILSIGRSLLTLKSGMIQRDKKSWLQEWREECSSLATSTRNILKESSLLTSSDCKSLESIWDMQTLLINDSLIDSQRFDFISLLPNLQGIFFDDGFKFPLLLQLLTLWPPEKPISLIIYGPQQLPPLAFDKLLTDLQRLKITRLHINGWELNQKQFQQLLSLKSLSLLTHLNLANNDLTATENLAHLENLEKINLSHNHITEIGTLGSLPKVHTLTLQDNKLTHISGLGSTKQLRSLNLSDNSIEKIHGLEWVPELEQLQLRNNKISDIAGLYASTKLRVLDLGWNNISKLENLDPLKELRHADFGHNPISSMDNLDTLPMLKHIDFGFTQITDVNNLDKYPLLRSISFDGMPPLKNLKNGLSMAPMLEEIYWYLDSSKLDFIETLGFTCANHVCLKTKEPTS